MLDPGFITIEKDMMIHRPASDPPYSDRPCSDWPCSDRPRHRAGFLRRLFRQDLRDQPADPAEDDGARTPPHRRWDVPGHWLR